MILVTFKTAYRLARTQRHNPLWNGIAFRFDGGSITINDGVLTISR